MENQIIEKIIETLKTQLEPINCKDDEKSEIFLSEDDLKFSFAQAVKTAYPEAKVILEYPIMTSELYSKKDTIFQNTYALYLKDNKSCKKCGRFNECKKHLSLKNKSKDFYEKCKKYTNSRSYVDLYFELGEWKYFIELKYKTVLLGCKRNKKDFMLADQSAGQVYSIYEDVERMENILNINDKNTKAFSITITNDSDYYSKHNDLGSSKKNFSLENSNDIKVHKTNSGILRYNYVFFIMETIDNLQYRIVLDKDEEDKQVIVIKNSNKTRILTNNDNDKSLFNLVNNKGKVDKSIRKKDIKKIYYMNEDEKESVKLFLAKELELNECNYKLLLKEHNDTNYKTEKNKVRRPLNLKHSYPIKWQHFVKVPCTFCNNSEIKNKCKTCNEKSKVCNDCEHNGLKKCKKCSGNKNCQDFHYLVIETKNL